jgi:hypothetical protein
VESRGDVSGLCHRGRIVLRVTALERIVKRVKRERFSRCCAFVVFFLFIGLFKNLSCSAFVRTI